MTTGRFRLLLLLLIRTHTPSPCSAPAHAPFLRVVEIALVTHVRHRRSSNSSISSNSSSHPPQSSLSTGISCVFHARILFSILFRISLSFFLVFCLLYTKFSFIYYLLFAFGKLQHFPFCCPLQRNIFVHVTFSNSFYVSTFSCCPTTTEGRKKRIWGGWGGSYSLLSFVLLLPELPNGILAIILLITLMLSQLIQHPCDSFIDSSVGSVNQCCKCQKLLALSLYHSPSLMPIVIWIQLEHLSISSYSSYFSYLSILLQLSLLLLLLHFNLFAIIVIYI